jgi:hypothetical protein
MNRGTRRDSTSQEAPQQEVPPVDKVRGAPDSPLELGKAGWRDTLKRSLKEFQRDR